MGDSPVSDLQTQLRPKGFPFGRNESPDYEREKCCYPTGYPSAGLATSLPFMVRL
jgi:hypothetical protein